MSMNKQTELPTLTIPEDAVADRNSENIADRVRQARSNRGLTLKELSLVTKVVDPAKQGISTVSISRYESGAEPGLRELRLLSLALRLPLAFFVYGDSDDPMHQSSQGIYDLPFLFEQMVADSVSEILEKEGLIQPKNKADIRDIKQYNAMIETIKKLD
jgi:transcriptional regulator with XRE-family HTH domain